MSSNKNKIAIISSSLGLGGAEKFASSLSFILSNLGFEIHNIIIEDKICYDISGVLINVGKIIKSDNFISRKIKKGIFLNKYLRKNKISIVVDNRTRPILMREFFTKLIYRNIKVIYMVHISKVEMYLSTPVFLSRLIYKSAHKMVCVSKFIEENLVSKYRLNNTITIYNPKPTALISNNKIADLPDKFFLYFGRLEEKQKNLTLMLESFKYSKVYEKNFYLLLIGDGESKSFLEKKIVELELINYVQIRPFTNKILSIVKEARASVLTSNYEGFPMSIIESLSQCTPVISVNCPSGPNEIVINEFNGLLVEMGNKIEVSNAFERFANDDVLYDFCKLNSQSSIDHLSVETIAKQWQLILK
jgi:glycosyltransferase involved in cell wall biosynthesis